MASIFEKFGFSAQKVEKNNLETAKNMQSFGEKSIDLFCKEFKVEGLDQLKEYKAGHPEEKFIVSSSHLNNLDVPAVLKTLGKDFNLQLTGESVLLEKMKYLGHKLLINLGGRENFTPLDYRENKDGKHGSFNPDNFVELQEKMESGKTPWIAAHPFSLDGKMKRGSIGPVYLAAKTNATIIPTALEVIGGSVNLEGAKESAKTLLNRSQAIYHIGSPLKLPPIDVSIIDEVIKKKSQGQEITKEELEAFTATHQTLKDHAEILAQAISSLLPEEKRGYYSTSPEVKK